MGNSDSLSQPIGNLTGSLILYNIENKKNAVHNARQTKQNCLHCSTYMEINHNLNSFS